jgi:hypothetical protein
MWRQIDGYENYSVSNDGVVRNDKYNRNVRVNYTHDGTPVVSLTKNGRTSHHSLAKLVAQAFDPPINSYFNTPTLLDGDKENVRIENVVWRPRWFAIKYHKQIRAPRDPSKQVSVIELGTHMLFVDAYDAATKYGLLVDDIITSAHTTSPVWPTFQVFEFPARTL